MLSRILFFAPLLVLVACGTKTKEKTFYVPVEKPVETRSLQTTSVLTKFIDISTLSHTKIDEVPLKLIEFSKKNELDRQKDESFLLDELNSFGCALDKTYKAENCILPDDIGALDYLGELAKELQLFSWNNNLYAREVNLSITKLGQDILNKVESTEKYKVFAQENSLLKREVVTALGCTITSQTGMGLIRTRVALFTLLQLQKSQPFENFINTNSIDSIVIVDEWFQHSLPHTTVLSWKLSVAEIENEVVK